MPGLSTQIPFNSPFPTKDIRDRFLEGLLEIKQLQGGGEYTSECEQFLEEKLGRNVLILDSCTSALELGLRTLGFDAEDEIIMPSFTFASCANACLLNGLKPVFVDIEPGTLNIDPEKVEAAISTRTRAVMVIHYAGVPADLQKIVSLCETNSLVLIEDNAHGFGGKYKGKTLGSFGEVATMSFHGTKNFSAGEGGALALSDRLNLLSAEIFREKGTDRSQYMRGERDKYTWRSVGSSMVLNEMSALLLRDQFLNFSEIQSARRNVWQTYQESLESWAGEGNISQAVVSSDMELSGHIYWLDFPDAERAQNFRRYLSDNGIASSSHYQPLHSSGAGRKYGRSEGTFQVTDKTAETIVRLPIYPDLIGDLQASILSTIKEFRH